MALTTPVGLPAAHAGLLTQDRCTDVSASYTVFKQGGIPLVDWRAVSGVLPLSEGKIVRFDPTDATPVPESVVSGRRRPDQARLCHRGVRPDPQSGYLG